MAINKTKTLEAAQKHLNQGKLAEAIGEYQQILRSEPRDQVALMTVGDLYVRLGELAKASEYFEKLAQLFLNEGFTSKAIALYKKIAKLAPAETQPLEHLAELYVQQGVMSEARPLFLQLAETHLKARRPQRAIDMLHKLLEVEPENQRVLARLAELYVAINQPKEAARALVGLAQRALDRGESVEAAHAADRAMQFELDNAAATAVKARALALQGDTAGAIGLLEKLVQKGGSRDLAGPLLKLYVQTGQFSRAGQSARELLQRGPDFLGEVFETIEALVECEDPSQGLDLVGDAREPLLEAGEHDRLAQALARLVERLPGRIEPLEWQVELHRRSNDSFRLPEALDQLADASVRAGHLEQAEALLTELVERDPENRHNLKRLNQVRAKLGRELAQEPEATEEVLPAKAEPAAPTAPPPEPSLDEETRRHISQALTDVDLYSSYGLTQKAIALLERTLALAPQHPLMLEKLLDLYLGAGDQRRIAEVAAALEELYLTQNNAAAAERFADLRRRFQRSAGISDEELSEALEATRSAARIAAPPEFTVTEPAHGRDAGPATEAGPAEPVFEEVDLSEEWAQLSAIVEEPAPAEAPRTAPQKPVRPEPAAVEEEPAEYELELSEADASPGEGPGEISSGSKVMSNAQFLSELAAEVGDMEAPEPEAPPIASRPRKPRPVEGESVEQLREVFDEFRSELGEMGDEEEDPETHYNLGIAYREMGLLEEAIGEFQKVAKAVEGGRPFRYEMQCRTLLGLSFLEKGEPKIATVWYRKALETPGLDQESILALQYDLGVAEELAGNPEAALDCFRQVYAMNIDYRDVAERIVSLSKR